MTSSDRISITPLARPTRRGNNRMRQSLQMITVAARGDGIIGIRSYNACR